MPNMIQFRIDNREDIERQKDAINNALEKGWEGGKPLIMELRRPYRNSISNAKFHAMIGDLWKQAVISAPGIRVTLKDYTFPKCKALLIVWFSAEKKLMGEPLSKPGETIVNPMTGQEITERPSTKDFSQSEACDFVEYLYNLGAECKVKWSEPALKVYDEYLRKSP